MPLHKWQNVWSKLFNRHEYIFTPVLWFTPCVPGGLPIALFPDGEDLSASGSGTPSEDDEVEGGEDDASNGSWEDIEEEEDVWRSDATCQTFQNQDEAAQENVFPE